MRACHHWLFATMLLGSQGGTPLTAAEDPADAPSTSSIPPSRETAAPVVMRGYSLDEVEQLYLALKQREEQLAQQAAARIANDETPPVVLAPVVVWGYRNTLALDLYRKLREQNARVLTFDSPSSRIAELDRRLADSFFTRPNPGRPADAPSSTIPLFSVSTLDGASALPFQLPQIARDLATWIEKTFDP